MNRLSFPPRPAWGGRDDACGPERMHQHVQATPLENLSKAQGMQLAFVGFACDEGVRRNKGRLGAASGPEELRKHLGNLSWSSMNPSCVDVGDLFCVDGDLESSQKELGQTVSALLKKRYTPIVLGGGHETAWGHFQGLAPHCENLLIVNFDAHYDMRPLVDGRWGSSGTPFFQIAEHCSSHKRNFSYTCIGIQKASNTDSLRHTAKQNTVHTIEAETLHSEGIASTNDLLKGLLASHENVYVSVCLDVFAQAFAPGVSAPQALGLSPWQVLPLLRTLASSGKVLAADFVELCPAFDRDAQTAKLGASLIWDFCTSLR